MRLAVTCKHSGTRSTSVDENLGFFPVLGKMRDLLMRCPECAREMDASTKSAIVRTEPLVVR